MSAINYPDKKEYDKRMSDKRGKRHNTNLRDVLRYLHSHTIKKLKKEV